ncbi:MAG TPA: hypothetical protein VML01_13550 [Bryobacterales bacterium]|nr:hypothetical protein [Bryobacterales bacterium]
MTCAFILRAALLLVAALPLSAHIPATDNNGNILTQIITPPGIAAITQTYTCDPLNRLAAAAESSAGSPWSRTYAYDRYGNRAVTANSGLGASPLMPGSLTDYDAAGNQARSRGGPSRGQKGPHLQNRLAF